MNRPLSNAMRAYVINEPGGPEQLVPSELPVPQPAAGRILIRVRAFGLNRSEWFTRRGESPAVRFPRVLGIECVGEVADRGDSDLDNGERVAAMMGGMGRDFDGSYAEYVSVPREHVFRVQTDLEWAVFGALPEMLQTTHGSLYSGLEIEHAGNLLVRGGTSSIGFTAIALARAAGIEVSATTRAAAKKKELLAAGADHVLVDNGSIVEKAHRLNPGGYDRVLELIGTSTLADSLQCARRGGIVCMTGILGGKWTLANFQPLIDIPTAVKLTAYSGNSTDISEAQLQDYVDLVERGELKPKLGPVYPFAALRDAHAVMDSNSANGKIVIIVD